MNELLKANVPMVCGTVGKGAVLLQPANYFCFEWQTSGDNGFGLKLCFLFPENEKHTALIVEDCKKATTGASAPAHVSQEVVQNARTCGVAQENARGIPRARRMT